MERLLKLKKSQNGFEIAEFDLELRGEGDIIGLRQSGLQKFRIADPFENQNLLELAKKEAVKYIEVDPYLETEKGKRVLDLLKLLGSTDLSKKI